MVILRFSNEMEETKIYFPDDQKPMAAHRQSHPSGLSASEILGLVLSTLAVNRLERGDSRTKALMGREASERRVVLRRYAW